MNTNIGHRHITIFLYWMLLGRMVRLKNMENVSDADKKLKDVKNKYNKLTGYNYKDHHIEQLAKKEIESILLLPV